VIEFHNLRSKRAVVLTTYIMNVLHKYKPSDKVIAFCGDNCNTNFGRAARRGTNNVSKVEVVFSFPRKMPSDAEKNV
jgi:hypothetical protein